MSKFIDKEEIKRKIQQIGWINVIGRYAPWLVDSPKLFHHHTCPIHGGLDGFRFYKDADETGGAVCNSCGNFPDGISLLTAATNKSFYDVLKDLAELLGHGEFVAPVQRKVSPREEKKRSEAEDKACFLRLRTAFASSIPVSAPGASLVAKYLASRGLSIKPDMLRFHPSMSYLHEDGSSECFPAMLAVVSAPDGSSVTLHRTYLDPETGKKAKVDQPKKLMQYPTSHSLKGAAIRLVPCTGDTLCVTEGIETALAVMEATGLPTWATISTVFMEGFIPPENVKRVIVFADKDRSEAGLNAAQKLVQNLWDKNIQASIELPPSSIPEDSKGIDWLDELASNGKANFPTASDLAAHSKRHLKMVA